MSLFNRPAWATARDVKDEGLSEDIFSHSKKSSYAKMVAEEQRRKKENEQKLRAKQERKERRTSAKREADLEDVKAGKATPEKRRRITLEEGDDLLGSVGMSPGLSIRRAEGVDSSTNTSHMRRSPRMNKAADRDDLRFNKALRPAVVEKPDDSDREDDAQFSHAQPAEPVDPDDDESDDDLRELKRQARARNKLREESTKKSQTPDAKSPTPGRHTADPNTAAYPTPPAPDPPVQLLISSQIEGTKQLMVFRKLSQRLQEIRQVWCDKQGFSKDFANKVYLVHRMRRVFDVTTCGSLGLFVDSEGMVRMKGSESVDGADRVHLEAVTDEIFAQMKAEKAKEDRKRQGLDEAEDEAQGNAPEPQVQPEDKLIPILLTSKDTREPFRLRVKQSTVISKIITACQRHFVLQEGQFLYLDFDGERLEPNETIGDTEISDMDRIDVHIS
ncbi:hypothetical protein LTR97_010304 [Elasticomyces elasticus]|uniref:Rad60/SUMO-like domain-containing protein n=1 Tax=Elasticomyces elasticus TaxID=574655 RepID=A0AAN7W196_9PEZI|nr:hypothetical protein LTR97_010304 [Elasticomyces elasticus]